MDYFHSNPPYLSGRSPLTDTTFPFSSLNNLFRPFHIYFVSDFLCLDISSSGGTKETSIDFSV